MPYKILNADGTPLFFLADNVIDESKTSLSLIGNYVTSYGASLNNNLVKLLENFAGNIAPVSPQRGQLWYDSSRSTDIPTLRIYTGTGFKPVSGVVVSNGRPALSNGDLWFDPGLKQAAVYYEGITYPIGPLFPNSYGGATGSGWVPTSETIFDVSGNQQAVIFLKNHGAFLGVASTTAFTLNEFQSNAYFNSTSASVVAGLTIKGDIAVTGQITSKSLSMNVLLSELGSDNTFNNENIKIMELLEKMFVVTPNTVTLDIGLPYGSEARVLCRSTSTGYQVRRFKISNPLDLAVASWQPYNIYSSGTTNLVP